MKLSSLKAKIVSITLELGAETPPETIKFPGLGGWLRILLGGLG